MIDRHAVQALVQSGLSTKEIAAQMGISKRSVQRIAKEPPVNEPDDKRARSARRVGRPPLPDRVTQRLRELAAEDPQAPPLEVLRQLREEGITLGESTFYRVFRIEKAKLPSALMVRFEGVPGE
ncbi:MAG TPA: helix-turn-helix domain-containing protein, partial [Longimicrobium sp.]|nr:helix-turn-helix domain-containing protein [Longimicrobium sp.]